MITHTQYILNIFFKKILFIYISTTTKNTAFSPTKFTYSTHHLSTHCIFFSFLFFSNLNLAFDTSLFVHTNQIYGLAFFVCLLWINWFVQIFEIGKFTCCFWSNDFIYFLNYFLLLNLPLFMNRRRRRPQLEIYTGKCVPRTRFWSILLI